MKARKYLLAAALIVGSVGIGSITTQGSGAVSSVLAAPAEEAGDEESYSFVPVTPYRAIDTRNIEGFPKLGAEATKMLLEVWKDEFGYQMIPETAVAVTYNLTVTETEGGGFITLFPGNLENEPETSSINWTGSNQTVGNGGTVAIGPFEDFAGEIFEGTLWALNPTEGAAHYILDITGYYK